MKWFKSKKNASKNNNNDHRITDAYVNYNTGAGSSSDKSQSGFFMSDWLSDDYTQLERTYVESWAAAKIIDIPVDDSFIYPRTISGLSENNLDKLQDFETYLNLDYKIKQALKAARLYGTAFLILVTDDNLLSQPYNPNAKITNLKNIIVADRFRAVVLEWDSDITTTNFNEPLLYQFTLRNTAPFAVHYSRVIRIDGIKPLTAERWSSDYNWYWGVSELARCIGTVTQEENMASVINYLLSEASVPILKVPDLQDALAGAQDALGGQPGDTVKPIDKLVRNMNDLKSVYRTSYLDADMSLERLEASFSNFSDVFDRLHTRLAAAADIPQTRFFGKSPAGMNSTGDSDMQNYAVHIASRQQKDIKPIYDKIDPIMCKTLGINERVEFSFRPLIDIGQEAAAKIELSNAQTDQIYLANGVITPDEVRQKLHDNDIYNIDPDEHKMGIDESLKNDLQKKALEETSSNERD